MFPAPFHPGNWYCGWSLLGAAFGVGAGIGLQFHREDFWGGYASFGRRIFRLGHVALAALGMVNLLFALSPWPASERWSLAAGLGFILGGIAMPAVCFLTSWRPGFRRLFFIPVLCLIAAVLCTLLGTLFGGTP